MLLLNKSNTLRGAEVYAWYVSVFTVYSCTRKTEGIALMPVK